MGNYNKLSEELQEQIIKTENFTKNNTGIVMNIALNYGGREEIINAVKKICDSGVASEEIDEKLFESYLYTKDQPDIDLLIRTSGEQRLSNFLLWQNSYSEFWFTDKLWPDFKKADLYSAILDFQNRNRRFGGV